MVLVHRRVGGLVLKKDQQGGLARAHCKACWACGLSVGRPMPSTYLTRWFVGLYLLSSFNSVVRASALDLASFH